MTFESPSLETLLENFYKASNALSKYRHEHGFEPGVKVVGKQGDGPEKIGFIAPYGTDWDTVDAACVPVLHASGRICPWNMRSLKVL